MFGSGNKVSWLGGTKSFADEDELIKAVNSGNLHRVRQLVNSNNFTSSDLNTISVDKYKNNLLHLSTMLKSRDLVSYFLDKGVSFNTKNTFGQTAWDLVVLTHDDSLTEKFVLYRVQTENSNTLKVSELTSENELLKSKNRELKRLSSGFESSFTLTSSELSDVTKKYNLRNREVTVLTTENNELKSSNRRLRDDSDRLTFEVREITKKYDLKSREVVVLTTENTELKSSNKRLRDDKDRLSNEVNDLSDKNKKLKVSVETLMANSKR